MRERESADAVDILSAQTCIVLPIPSPNLLFFLLFSSLVSRKEERYCVLFESWTVREDATDVKPISSDQKRRSTGSRGGERGRGQ